jgi:ketosteroid isomerase-like protein
MSQENVEIVRRGYELYAAGELEDVAGLIADDAELADAGGLGVAGTAVGTRHGPEGFLRASEEVMEAFEDYRVEPEEFIDADDTVVVTVRISGRGRVSGAKQEMRVAHLWVLRHGKVVRGEVYRTTEEALEATGGSKR